MLVVSVLDRLTGPVQGMAKQMARFQASIQAASTKLKKWGEGVGDWGKKISIGAAAGAVALAGLLRPTMAVDKASRALQTVITPMYGSMEEDMKRVRTAAQEWEKTHVGSAEQFIQTSYGMVSAGLTTAQAIEGTRAATALATATFGDATEAAGYLATLYNNLGNKAGDAATEMTRLADITAKTQQFHQIANLGQLTEGMKYATPVAKMYGISLEQVSAVVGTLNDSGIAGGQAGTAFAAMMRGMNGAAKDLGFAISRTAEGGVDLVGTMENLKAKFGSRLLDPQVQQQLQEAFGDEGLKGVMSLMDKTQRLRDSMTALGAATGTVAAALATVEGGIEARFVILKQRLVGVAVTLGEKLVPLIERLAPKFEKAIQAVTQFIEKNPQLAETVIHVLAISTAVGAVAGPLLMLVGGAMKVVGAFLGFRAVQGLLARVAVTAGIGIPGALGAADKAGTQVAGSLAGKFGKLLGILGKILVLWEVFKGVGSLGRDAAGKLDAWGQESQARAKMERARKVLADPTATRRERLMAQKDLESAGWHTARAADIRRDVAAGGYLANEQIPGVKQLAGVEHTPSSAPRQMARIDVARGLGGIQLQGVTLAPAGARSMADVLGGYGMGMPGPGQLAVPGQRDAGGTMQVEDPKTTELLRALYDQGAEAMRQKQPIFVQLPDGSLVEAQAYQGAAREAAY
jgi:TP901 family phage tail tape measure protein